MPCSTPQHTSLSFNPCCIGLAIAAGSGTTIIACENLFQSLLYWISHCGRPLDAINIVRIWFQSLLYWISHCGTELEHVAVFDVDVSILVVLD